MNKFNRGDTVWHARWTTKEKRVLCPECFGKGYLTVILGDDSKVTIDCAGCAQGFRGPTGYVSYWEATADVSKVVIDRIAIGPDGVEYGFHGRSCVKEDALFLTQEEAQVRAVELSGQHNAEAVANIRKKEHPTRTWAWHVHYHRDCIRRAEKDLAYHKAKLEAGKKEGKA